MKKLFVFAAAAALAMTACMKEEAPVNGLQDQNLVPMEFTATSDVDTKTALVPGENGKVGVIWKADDKISVWDGTGNREFTVKSCDGSKAVFTGSALFCAVAKKPGAMAFTRMPTRLKCTASH